MALKGRPTRHDETTASAGPPSAACQLFVAWSGGSALQALASRGTLEIGRSADAGLSIPDASVSRRHVRLYMGAPIEIEDLGSANGTRVDGVALEPGRRQPVVLGSIIELGAVRAVVSRAASFGGDAPAPSAMSRVHDIVDRIAPGSISVVLVGETGAGKDVLAHEIHRRSPRRDKPFVPINCAALTENLLESELFGYERGAFTGATSAKAGLLETADGGTILLDEIGEMPLSIQAKLLRVIETRQISRLGSVKGRAIDVRFVAATHRDLDAFVILGRFREDLLFRLNGMTVVVPPLRDRGGEIPQIVEQLVGSACASAGRSAMSVSRDAMTLLASYRWPGNIRELRNVVERAVLLCRGEVIEVGDIVLGRAGAVALPAPAAVPPGPETRRFHPSPPASVLSGPSSGDEQEHEREEIVRVLAACAGNQTMAAEQLGITRRMLTYRIEKLGLPRPRARPKADG